MSASGIYLLILNDGQQDRMLYATSLLNKRLREIRRLRSKHPAIRDSTPTLIDIERTHILFMNNHFRPFASVAYQYASIGSQSPVAFGREALFSIPQFGDFFSDCCIHVVLRNLTPGPLSERVRYCDFIGHRLLKLVRFEVNGNYLDEYDSDVYNFHYNFMVPEYKRTGWRTINGMENPNQAYLTQNPNADDYRLLMTVLDGPQTAKPIIPFVEMYIPLLFW